jgi:two-component system, sensor histidine kinase and response regulator
MDDTTPPDDRTGPTRAERRLAAQYETARAVAESTTLAEATPKVLLAICQALGWEHAALWNVDRKAGLLRCVETCHVPTLPFKEFEAASRRITFASGVGLPGRVWASGKPVWIPDVVRDSNFPRAAVAAREGLHAAFGFPILLGTEILAVMEFFSREIRQPDDDLLRMLAAVGSQLGLLIERKRAEEELNRFFALSLDMLCIANFDGYFVRLNPAWSRALGFAEQELLGRPYLDFIHPDDRESTLAEARRLATGAELISFENRYRCKDGSYKWLLWTAVPSAEQGRIYAAARDITDRKRAEAELMRYAREMEEAKQAQEANAARLDQLVKQLEAARRRAEEATRAKGNFLAAMSHEIRTPMNAILGMTQLALDTKLNAEQRDYLRTVKDSTDALLTLINDILDFSKIEAGKLDLDRVEFNLRDTLEDTLKVLSQRAQQKGLELACRIRPDVPERVQGDPGRLRQILLNLVGNGIKFTERGEVVLHADVESSRDGEIRLHAAVADTGIGIPPEKRRLIFEAFEQADASTTREYGGTGLGLAICSQLVELMGGKLWVESRVGQGSTFHFTVVLGARGDRARTPARLKGVSALVVDDNATNRLILEETLSSWRMRPTAADSARAALAAIERASAGGRPFRVVLADALMPEMDGFTLARRIRQNPRFAQTRVILLTSAGARTPGARSRSNGISACLTKPVKQSDLLDALLTSLHGPPSPGARASSADSRTRIRQERRRILVAEDNAVNQKLLVSLLKKRGHSVEVVDNGRKAVTAVRERPFDLVLMDLQMPVMGGFEAASAIRGRERSAGGHVPIVAVTAHALEGERERCLAAGMDGYLSKPVRAQSLYEVVEELGRRPPGSAPGASGSRSSGGDLDEGALLAGVGGDRRLLRELVDLFLADSPKLVARIGRAVKDRDAASLARAAHSLKGSAGMFSRKGVFRSAQTLEGMGRDGQWAGAGEALASLRRDAAALGRALASLRNRLVRGKSAPGRRPAPPRKTP